MPGAIRNKCECAKTATIISFRPESAGLPLDFSSAGGVLAAQCSQQIIGVEESVEEEPFITASMSQQQSQVCSALITG